MQVPILFKQIVDRFSETSPGAAELLAAGSANGVFSVAGTVLFGYVAARLGSSLFSELRNVVFATVAQSTIRRAAVSVFAHLLRLDHSFHARANPGGLSRVIDRGIKGISFSFTALLFNIVPTAVEIGLVCGVMTWHFGAAYAVVTGGTMAAYAIFTSGITSWRTRFRRSMNAAETEASTRAYDSLLHHETVKNFRKETWETEAYSASLRKYESAALDTTNSLFLLNFGQQAILSGALTLVMWMAGGGILRGVATVGDLVMVNALIFQLSLPLNFLGSVYREMRQSFVDMEALFALKRMSPIIADTSAARPLRVSTGSVELRNVSFSYGPERESVLQRVSLTIPGGRKVAFVGTSGSGKSTLARLLLRHVDPQSGAVLIDGQPIAHVTLDSLRDAVGIVSQDTVLFNRSLRFNIAYGASRDDPESVSTDEIVSVARTAALHDTITARFPDAYETKVGERGVMLSGGERQRVAIARLLLRRPPIMIFDEATSALDTQTEHAILAALRSATESKPTMIFIAHRLTTIMDADVIYVLDGGHIVQCGTHATLLENHAGLYHRLWNAQQNHAVEQ